MRRIHLLSTAVSQDAHHETSSCRQLDTGSGSPCHTVFSRVLRSWPADQIETETARTPDEAKTAAYISSLDLRTFELRGSDFVAERFSPTRIGKPLDEIDRVYDYDFDRLAEVERRLSGIDREKVLKHIYDTLTDGLETNTEKHVEVLRFLHKAIFHNIIQPMYPDGRTVTDPLVLLELGEMKCGRVAGLAVDIFTADGFQTRCVALGHHIIAEIFYDGAWHYLDADHYSNGFTAFKPDGTIPSVVELSYQPEVLDALPHKNELTFCGRPRLGGMLSPSSSYFTPAEPFTCCYYTKRPADEPAPAADDPFFGWRNREKSDAYWKIQPDRKLRFQPGAVRFESIEILPGDEGKGRLARVAWKPAVDRDNDLLGYRVYVSAESRGWHYSRFAGSEAAEAYWHRAGGWQPEQYDRLTQLPPHELAIIKTTETSVEIPLNDTTDVFVTVAPFDEYHETVGKTIYLMSNGLRLPGD